MTARTDMLWEEFGGQLERFVLRVIRDPHDAEDVLQEVFLKAHVALTVGGFDDRGTTRAWLYRIAGNAVADHHRRGRLAPLPQGADANVAYEEAGEEGLFGPENANGDIVSCLGPMIDGLPDGHRRALVLADLEGKTQKEVSEELGLSLSGAKSRVQRARRKLRANLTSCCRLELDRLGNVLDYRPKGAACRYCSC